MNPTMFTLFGYDIKWYSVLILVAVIVGHFLITRESKKFKMNQDFIFNLVFWTVIFGLIGARLYYVAFNWSSYASDPISILKVWQGGLAIHGGLLFGFITLCLYCRKYNVRIAKITDIAAPAVLLGQAIGRWGNFFNSEAHGVATTLANLESIKIIPQFVIEGMKINGIYYQPTFYYESLWCLLGVIIILIVRRFKKIHIGQITNIYFMWYSVGRFFIEKSRTDSLMFSGFKVAQLVSIALFVINLILFIVSMRKGKYEDTYASYEVEEIRY